MAAPRVERVAFDVGGARVVGHLHLPAGPGRAPAVVVAGPMTGVKEQVTGVYAGALARRGFAALAVDHRHFGESGGEPRQYEHHGRKVDDLRAALAELSRRPEVDPERLGLVGVCLGAGYAAWAAALEPRVRALGAVVGYYRDPGAMRANDPAGFDAKIAQGVRARERYEATGEVLTIPAAALEGDAAMTTRDTVDYYTARAAVPNYRNAFAVMSREHFVPFDVQAAAPRLGVPVAMVHSEAALSPAWARSFYGALGGPKRIEWLASRGHTDFYDDPGLVGAASDLLAGHLAAHLAG
ncbi:MAG TPA: dienelactone hydrolase family protein [Polyangiaceae bacterium]|nr:dienelactone hydrolase family protein [Polyangiaceae bacterium]